MGLGREVELRGLAPGLFELVGVLVGADGDGVVGQVGNLLRSARDLEIGFDCAGLEGGDAVFEGGGLERYGGDVLALALEATDLLREGVALGLEGLDLSDSGAACACRARRNSRGGKCRRRAAAVFLRPTEVGSDKSEIEHILLILAGDRTKCVGVGPGSIYSGACGDWAG